MSHFPKTAASFRALRTNTRLCLAEWLLGWVMKLAPAHEADGQDILLAILFIHERRTARHGRKA